MHKKLKVISTVVLFGLATGCVSTSKYKKLEDEKAGLQTKSAAEIEALKKENTDLKANVEQLQGQSAALAAERDTLKQNKQATDAQYNALVGQLAEELKNGELQIKQYKNMMSVDVAEKIFFASGSAQIKDSGRKVLKKVGEALAKYQDKVIRVVGHTDNVPLGTAAQEKFPTNWELSVMRATNVVRFLQDECKILPERLIASGAVNADLVFGSQG
jgi:chemotaxis protein MotB